MKQRRWCRGFETLFGFMRNLQEMPGDKRSRGVYRDIRKQFASRASALTKIHENDPGDRRYKVPSKRRNVLWHQRTNV